MLQTTRVVINLNKEDTLGKIPKDVRLDTSMNHHLI